MERVRFSRDRRGAGRTAARRPAGLLLVLIALAAVGTMPRTAAADPTYEGPLLYGLDPVVRGTRDPRLLGVDRLVLLRRLQTWGIDPYREPNARPDLSRSIRQYWKVRSGVDLEREESLIEFNGPLRLMTEIQYPSYFFLFPTPESLPGGYQYYPPRPLGDPVVRLFVDDLRIGADRRFAVARVLARTSGLDVTGRGQRGDQEAGLINLTIPIKLPRTLEKIIGRGEKTKIKITGRERLAITGESTVVNPFTPSERISSQSLFPTLDMEQELQISLSGTIGEKIIIEVDHNSAAIGPDATKIKLMYQGDEDEIIKTIETGDVGLTLPGSQLLGYSSNKSGLFGFKVTGQVGRVDFTAVASKQKAESSSKTFNAKGGQVSEKVFYSSDYLNNQFFQLDLPLEEPQGRLAGETIDISSVKIFKLVGPGTPLPGEVTDVAVYPDTLGFRAWDSVDFTAPYTYGKRWSQIELTQENLYLDADGNLVAIDLGSNQGDATVLACTYRVLDAQNKELAQVGDDPERTGPTQDIPDSDVPHYRMKLLKAQANKAVPHVFRYVLRNIYSLGGAQIDPATFDFRIEFNDQTLTQPFEDENGIDYIEIFGLDRENAQGEPIPDGVADYHDPLIFDLDRGLLKFPLDFLQPFAPPDSSEAYAANVTSTDKFQWEGTRLAENQTPELYDPDTLPTEYFRYQKFRIVTQSASSASSFNLGVSNIEEESEVVTVDGRTLTRGVDYEIDYTFGELTLRGEAANLTPDSKVSVTYQYSPFFGGGNTTLMGLNLAYDLGRESSLGTTWLYQSESIVGEKAKLGEEPSRTVVGDLNFNHTMKPTFLTGVANLLSRQNTERESSLQISGESAISLPNPNTKGRAYLEDFEGVDSSDIITLTRLSWFYASVPYVGETDPNPTLYTPENRVDQVRWFLPKERVLRRYLNPELVNQERDETQQAMNMYLRSSDGVWSSEEWGGIMRGISRSGLDLSKAQFVEIWVNDGQPDIDLRRGRLHIDFGYIDEDGFWPKDQDGNLITGRRELEDVNNDGVFTYDEDIGLDGNENGPERYDAAFDIDGDTPYPRINGTARNQREDDEDLNANSILDRDNGFYTTVIDLKETPALVDVDYDYENVDDLRSEGIAWRKYRIPLGEVDRFSSGTSPNIKAVTHARIWYEDPTGAGPAAVEIQLSDFRFLGSRWERDGVRRIAGEILLEQDQLPPGEEFFLGEVNNKENPDYQPPFPVHEVNNIPEKEQALVLDFKNIQRGHMVRASKQVSARGDDYTGYTNLTWYYYNPDHVNADLDIFFRVGADTLNYYEIDYSFADSARKTGWKALSVGIAELSNVKLEDEDAEGVRVGTVNDYLDGTPYQVRVVGRPDLRRVRRYFYGIKNEALSIPATGYFYLNDVVLDGVKRDVGMANRAGLRLNMADVIKFDVDWSYKDAEYHGLNARTGSGVNVQDLNMSGSLNVDDFVPLAGFRLPVSASQQSSVSKPKYEINSDVEILDPSRQEELATRDRSQRFSSRLSRTPSKGALLRYLVDPWTVLFTGSRRNADGPLERRRDKNLSGSLTYDLRIAGDYRLGRYPLLGSLPIVKGVSFLPSKIALGASFTSLYSSVTTIDSRGIETVRPEVRNRPGKLTANVDYRPVELVDMVLGAVSDRDLLRHRDWNGINIGEENKRTYDLRMTLVMPRGRSFGESRILAPVRALAQGLNTMRPNVSFQGTYVDIHDPATRQLEDPENVRSVSNSGRWEVRMDVPVGDAFKKVWPEHKYSQQDQRRMIEEQRNRERQQMRQAGRDTRQPNQQPEPQTGRQELSQKPTQGDTTDLPVYPPEMTPEEIQKAEAERLLREAEEHAEKEREMGLGVEEAPADTTGGGHRVDPLALVRWIPNTIRNTTPVKITFTDQKSSSYARLTTMPDFWYQVGLAPTFDVDESLYKSYGFDRRKGINVATTSRVTKDLSLDLKFGQSRNEREQLNTVTRTYKRDWPEAQVTLSGLERFRIFGGKPHDPEAGWFQSSSLNLSYKKSLAVSNYTPTSYNPNRSWSIGPRWNMTFRSGLTATLNATVSKDDTRSNGIITLARKSRYGIQLRHQFNAQSFLAKLGLYRPGSSQSVNMDVDISYQRDRTERINPGGKSSAPTGLNRLNVNPRFSYQITRSLSGAVRFIFSRSRNIATNVTTTTLGLGVEATFVF